MNKRGIIFYIPICCSPGKKPNLMGSLFALSAPLREILVSKCFILAVILDRIFDELANKP
jgi:hypothetical protein